MSHSSCILDCLVGSSCAGSGLRRWWSWFVFVSAEEMDVIVGLWT